MLIILLPWNKKLWSTVCYDFSIKNKREILIEKKYELPKNNRIWIIIALFWLIFSFLEHQFSVCSKSLQRTWCIKHLINTKNVKSLNIQSISKYSFKNHLKQINDTERKISNQSQSLFEWISLRKRVWISLRSGLKKLELHSISWTVRGYANESSPLSNWMPAYDDFW